MDTINIRAKNFFLSVLISGLLILALAISSMAIAAGAIVTADEQVAEQVKSLWERGATTAALNLLTEAIPTALHPNLLDKLHADILSILRSPQEAVAAYEALLTKTPTALDVRWAKWSVLTRSGQGEEAIAELQRIARVDIENPLIHFRLGQELRRFDRLEESLASSKKAVALAPDLLGWRLAMARTQFDMLDYQSAENTVQEVLRRISFNSPLELPAKNLLAQIHGTSMERGRRFIPELNQDMTSEQRKEWASIRAEAWNFFSTGQYQKAEPIYRRLLVLNPQDAVANHQLGLTLMLAGRCKDALKVFRNMSGLHPTDEDYADTVFRMGQCLVELEQWEEAFVHFQILYEAALTFEKDNKNVDIPSGTRVLNKEKIAQWIKKVEPHVPDLAQLATEMASASILQGSLSAATALSTEELYAKAVAWFKPQNSLDPRAALMGRDADFSWFRFVIPAQKIARDDFPTGAHEFIPINSGDSFPHTQREIYLVFGLTAASHDAIPLAARCFLETPEMMSDLRPVAQDDVMATMNDQSGYFMLRPPLTGWLVGLYQCGLFAGEQPTADTLVDEVRFRIIAPPPTS